MRNAWFSCVGSEAGRPLARQVNLFSLPFSSFFMESGLGHFALQCDSVAHVFSLISSISTGKKDQYGTSGCLVTPPHCRMFAPSSALVSTNSKGLRVSVENASKSCFASSYLNASDLSRWPWPVGAYKIAPPPCRRSCSLTSILLLFAESIPRYGILCKGVCSKSDSALA